MLSWWFLTVLILSWQTIKNDPQHGSRIFFDQRDWELNNEEGTCKSFKIQLSWKVCVTWRARQCKEPVCSTSNPQSCLASPPPPKSRWYDGRRWINEVEKCTRESTALRTKFRGGVRVQACHAAVWIEFAFGRLGVITTQTSWLAQAGGGVLIGQRAYWLITQAR